MWKRCLVLTICISFCGCSTVQHYSPAGAAAKSGHASQPTVEFASSSASDEQPPAQAAESNPILAQNAVEPKSGGWNLLWIAGALLFVMLLSMGAAGGAG